MLMQLERFKRLAVDSRRAGAPAAKRPTDTVLRKEFFGPAEVLGERQLRFTISTANVDRAQDVIDQTGWDLEGYRRNPVVLWQHDSWSMPIGRCVDIGLEAGALRATVEFVRADMPMGVGEQAETVLMMCKEGFLSATSVGFRPIEFDVTTDPARGADEWLPGFDFRRQDLTEFSIVTIPCNADAVIDPAHREQPIDPVASLRDLVGASAAAVPQRVKLLRRHQFDCRFPA